MRTGHLIAGVVTFTTAGAASLCLYYYLRDRSSKRRLFERVSTVNCHLLVSYADLQTTTALPPHLIPSPTTFYSRLADICGQQCQSERGLLNRALDVGCGVGRSSFELCRHFASVVAIESSALMYSSCLQLQNYQQLVATIPTEGDAALSTAFVAQCDSQSSDKRLKFCLEDGADLPKSLGKFGCVLLCDSLTRLQQLDLFLQTIPDFVLPSGLVVIASDYTWNSAEVTRSEAWSQSTLDEKRSTFDCIRSSFASSFELIDQLDLQHIVPVSQRQFTLKIIHVTVWKKK